MEKEKGRASTFFQLIKFAITGGLNTLVDLGGFSVLNTLGAALFKSEIGWVVSLAQVVSYSLGVLNSWLINSTWTFEDNEFSWGKVGRFVLVNLLSLGVNLALLHLMRTVFGMDAFVAKLIATPFGLIVNFIGSRLFVFKKGKK